MTSREIYFSIDVETDGPIPGPNSMLSLGAAAFLEDGTLIDTFYGNLETMEGAVGDPSTMAWWASQPEAWKTCREHTKDPGYIMFRFSEWIHATCQDKYAKTVVPHKPVFVGYPAGFDFLFVYWYLIKFTGNSPFSFSAVDIKTLAWAHLLGNYRDATKKHFPKSWMSKHPHTHVAVDDAIEQGEMFCNILKTLKNHSSSRGA